MIDMTTLTKDDVLTLRNKRKIKINTIEIVDYIKGTDIRNITPFKIYGTYTDTMLNDVLSYNIVGQNMNGIIQSAFDVVLIEKHGVIYPDPQWQRYVMSAYIFARIENQTIPDDHLLYFKDTLLQNPTSTLNRDEWNKHVKSFCVCLKDNEDIPDDLSDMMVDILMNTTTKSC